jgi:hypothetical protein
MPLTQHERDLLTEIERVSKYLADALGDYVTDEKFVSSTYKHIYRIHKVSVKLLSWKSTMWKKDRDVTPPPSSSTTPKAASSPPPPPPALP